MKKAVSFLLVIITMFLAVPNTFAVPIFGRHGKVLVLTYHKISEKADEWNDFCISPKIFEEDIKALKKSGYIFMTASQLANDPKQKEKKIAVITFDDGYESDLKYALPVLEKYGACATFFIFGGALNTKDYLKSEQLKKLSESQYAEIGNHSYKLHLKRYSTLLIMYNNVKYKSEILSDYRENAKLIKTITGKMPTALSYPNGVYSKDIDKELKADGYKITFSTEELQYSGSITYPVGRRNRGYMRNIQNIIK